MEYFEYRKLNVIISALVAAWDNLIGVKVREHVEAFFHF
jgi:hypothetical protein